MKSITLNMTGETITFIKTGKETNGEYTEIICTIPAGQDGPPPHIHPLQDEYFEALSGNLELSAEGKKITLEPGQSFLVKANISHTFSNKTNEEIKFKAVYRPALNIDYLLIQSFDRMNNMPNPKRPGFQLLIDFDFILKQIPGQYKFAGFPDFVLSFLAAIGKLFLKPKALSLDEYSNTN